MNWDIVVILLYSFSFAVIIACNSASPFISYRKSEVNERQVKAVAQTDNDEVRKFWEDREQEIGEKIRIYTLGEYRQGDLDFTPPKVGLVYITETTFYFQTFPKSNWFASLIGGFKKKQKEDEPITLAIPFSLIHTAEHVKPTFMEKLFSAKMPVIRIVYSDVTEKKKQMVLATDSRGGEIVNSINLYKE